MEILQLKGYAKQLLAEKTEFETTIRQKNKELENISSQLNIKVSALVSSNNSNLILQKENEHLKAEREKSNTELEELRKLKSQIDE